MQIDFNELRSRITTTYNSIIHTVNQYDSGREDEDCHLPANEFEEVKRNLGELRDAIVTLNALMHKGGNQEPFDANEYPVEYLTFPALD